MALVVGTRIGPYDPVQRQAKTIAKQIADALEAVHDQGISIAI